MRGKSRLPSAHVQMKVCEAGKGSVETGLALKCHTIWLLIESQKTAVRLKQLHGVKLGSCSELKLWEALQPFNAVHLRMSLVLHLLPLVAFIEP